MQVDDRWYVNVDVKKIYLDTDINLNNGSVKVNDADVDPWVFGAGIGYRF